MTYSIAARHIATWDILAVEPGPDRIIIKGKSYATSKTSQSSTLGVRYDQIDQLIIDLLTAKRHAEEV